MKLSKLLEQLEEIKNKRIDDPEIVVGDCSCCASDLERIYEDDEAVTLLPASF
mgnify:CR=1 FL=1